MNYKNIGDLQNYWLNWMNRQYDLKRLVVKSYDFKIEVTYTRKDPSSEINILTVHGQ